MSEDKPILSIETSGNLCGACIYFSDEKYFEASLNLRNSHSEKLFEQIDFVIKSSRIKITNLKCIAVSAGPGSFTGLRIGMSAAKGLAFGTSLPIVPVPYQIIQMRTVFSLLQIKLIWKSCILLSLKLKVIIIYL